MKNKLWKSRRGQAGYTLIEVAAVIFLLLILATGAVMGVSYAINSGSRNVCIVQLKKIQDAVRSYAAFNQIAIGGAVTMDNNASTGLIGATDKPFSVEPDCPNNGVYTFRGSVPAIGTPYTTCNLHAPSSTANW